MIRLGINIDHIATIRELRGTPYPDIVAAARLAKAGGADQITIHLREDRRHIKDGDLKCLRAQTDLPINLEMAAVNEISRIAAELRPDSATIVPEKRMEKTTERGLNLRREREMIEPHLNLLKSKGIKVSLFIDSNPDDIVMASELLPHAVELHTGEYCLAENETQQKEEIKKIKIAAELAQKKGLKVAAGHGLNYENTKTLIEAVPEIEELNIGHSIVARAVFVGLDKAVAEMKSLIRL